MILMPFFIDPNDDINTTNNNSPNKKRIIQAIAIIAAGIIAILTKIIIPNFINISESANKVINTTTTIIFIIGIIQTSLGLILLVLNIIQIIENNKNRK